MTRREVLAVAGAVPAYLSTVSRLSGAAEGKARMGATTSAFRVRRSAAREADKPFSLMDHAHSLGMGGLEERPVQGDAAAIKAYRQKLEDYGMYYHADIRPPQDKSLVADFEKLVISCKEAGAELVSAAMTGRRFEVFDSLDAFRQHKEQCMKSFQLAEPVLRRQRMKLAIENHKDWRWQEFVEMLKKLDSEWIGVRLDTGNSVALCDDPMEVIDGLAPYAFACHMKDMAVDEYEEGFLLSEVPFGEGIVDLKRVVQTVRKAHPEIRFALEQITRDPLEIPVFTDKYWVTFSSPYSPIYGRDLAHILKLVKANKKELPRISHLSAEDQVRAEDENNRKCIEYGHAELEM